MKPKRIVLAGGTGFLGQCLQRHYQHQPVEVVVLTRQARAPHDNVRYVAWDGRTSAGEWATEVDGCDLLINLSGRTVNCRYTSENQRQIINSRVKNTRVLGEVLAACAAPPPLWINAGSAAIYGNAGPEEHDEHDPRLGTGFSAEVCRQWEAAFAAVDTPRTRKVYLRIGLVLGLPGGVLEPFLRVVRWGLGGTIGHGNQGITWLDELDFCRLIDWLEEQPEVAGVINAAAPNPVSNVEFMRELRRAVGAPVGLPGPAPLVRLGTWLLGTESELVLTGRYAVSRVLREQGFPFDYPHLRGSLRRIFGPPQR
ncbi:TIGR01777 family oxidoreductase [Hymenobacter koreensis]|uniref:TIGR01777 family oxidoreductase n=1 Tax=Hymenobacter koreensis TaxID=1084523 RepID=A0ABP8J6A4_9BACT